MWYHFTCFFTCSSLRCILAEGKVAFIHSFLLHCNLSLSSHITKKIKASNTIGWKNMVSSKSNASYFMTLAHDVRERWWWCASIPLHFVAMWLMAAEGQSDTVTSDMEVHMKQRCVTEFLLVEKNGTHWHSLTLAECWWRPNSGCEHNEVASGAFW